MPEPTSDLVWLTCLLHELRADFADRVIRLRRHNERAWVWIDGGADRSWVADMTPGASKLQRTRPDDDTAQTEWRLWGGRRTGGAQIVDGTVLGGDRVLALRLDWTTRLGESAVSDLVIEFGGRHTNALVITVPEGIIVDVLRPFSGKVNRYRELLPNRVYAPPPQLNRASLLDPWPWDAASAKTVRSFLATSFLAMSRVWADEICRRCDIEPDTRVGDLAPDARNRVEETVRGMLDGTATGTLAPYVLLDENGTVVDHVAFEPTHLPPERYRVASSVAEAIDAVWSARSQVAERSQQERGSTEYVKRRRRELERRRENLRADLERTERVDELQRTADLIVAHVAQIPARATEFEAVDWYDPQQRRTTIRLDPDRTPVEQAERLYTRARKLRESIPHINQRLAKTERELARIEAIAEHLDAGGEPTPEILNEMARLRQHDDTERPDRQFADGIRPRRYRTREGNWLVLVGRNDRENDAVSLKIAAPDDLWFHAQGVPGSHVLLRKEGRAESPSRMAIGEAAGVAAYWSKARGAQKVGVSYTEAKYVRKPKGASPGTVTIRHEKLITVPPALLPREDELADEQSDEG